MKAGKLRNKITIESKSTAQDAYGAPVETWATYATAWASIAYPEAGGAESVVAGRVQAEVSAVFSLRYVAGVTNAMRVKFGTRIFSIVAVENTHEANREIRIRCEEIT